MLNFKPVIQSIHVPYNYQCSVLRLDLIDPVISGNKWFKLKHNLEVAKSKGLSRILTFGGAYSNHIAATAAAANRFGFSSIGIIRGEPSENPTLAVAAQNGMKLHFVSREEYRKKTTPGFTTKLREQFGDVYIIPEGGSNIEGVIGCMEILKDIPRHDYVFCACGTATTFAGLVASAPGNSKVLGISVLKGENKLPSEINKRLLDAGIKSGNIAGNEAISAGDDNTHLITNTYCFSGYASCNSDLIAFKKNWEAAHNIPLDYVYTAKLMYAAEDLMNHRFFAIESKILLIHSGGLQGNEGFENRYHLTPIR